MSGRNPREFLRANGIIFDEAEAPPDRSSDSLIPDTAACRMQTPSLDDAALHGLAGEAVEIDAAQRYAVGQRRAQEVDVGGVISADTAGRPRCAPDAPDKHLEN